MQNGALSELFGRMADVMEILAEDRFRVNTYRKVARIIADTPVDIGELLESGRLAEVPGIGKSSLAKIEQFVHTGRIEAHEALLRRIPAGLLELLRIPSMGPKSVKAVYEALGVTGMADLKAALESGAVAELPGFGRKKTDQLLKGIAFLEKATGRIRLDQAAEAAQIVGAFLAEIGQVKAIVPAGSLRRRCETIGDVDILVTVDEADVPRDEGRRTMDERRGAAGMGTGRMPVLRAGETLATHKGRTPSAQEAVIEAFTAAPFVDEVLASGPTKGSARIRTVEALVQVDVRVVAAGSFGAACQYFTGSKAHNVALRELAVKAGLKLNEYGLFDGEKPVAAAEEADIYKALGLDYIDPRLREDRGEIEAARNHTLPAPVSLKDIRGDLHMHTTASDGEDAIEEMAQAARRLGYRFICITDHSQSSAIANGLSARRLARQVKAIRTLNEKSRDLTILAGVELDILADGRLDFDDAVLADLDYVTASIHSGMAGDREKLTTRMLKAMDSRYVNCISHPTGRLINERGAMDLDMEQVVRHAARTHTALEVNANPWRLDLKDTHCRMAVEAGAMLAIGTDAHSAAGLTLMAYGVDTAARGWATKKDLLNGMTVRQLQVFVNKKR